MIDEKNNYTCNRWFENQMICCSKFLEWFLKDERFVDNTDEIINWINLNKWIKIVK